MTVTGWSVFNTTNATSNTITYSDSSATGGTYPVWTPPAPKVETPLDWLHGEVEAICRLGRLED